VSSVEFLLWCFAFFIAAVVELPLKERGDYEKVTLKGELRLVAGGMKGVAGGAKGQNDLSQRTVGMALRAAPVTFGDTGGGGGPQQARSVRPSSVDSDAPDSQTQLSDTQGDMYYEEICAQTSLKAVAYGMF